MTIKEILLHLDGHANAEARLRLAVAIAQPNRARLVGIYGLELPKDPPRRLFAEVYAENHKSWDAYQRDVESTFSMAEQIAAYFRAETARAGLSSEWRTTPDNPTDLIALLTEHAHYADLVVLGQSDPTHPHANRLAGEAPRDGNVGLRPAGRDRAV